jgi:hypothetical protein
MKGKYRPTDGWIFAILYIPALLAFILLGTIGAIEWLLSLGHSTICFKLIRIIYGFLPDI